VRTRILEDWLAASLPRDEAERRASHFSGRSMRAGRDIRTSRPAMFEIRSQTGHTSVEIAVLGLGAEKSRRLGISRRALRRAD